MTPEVEHDHPPEPPSRPLGFLLTASELEGVAPTADWSRWISHDRAPESRDGAGFRSTWRDDLEQLAQLGANEIAITLEWARLWPTANAPDGEEVEFRRDLLSTINELGLTPWGCLIDGTLPGWFADDERGFTDDKTRNLLWPRHVDWIGETFGDLVGGWIPMREPRQWAAWGHLVGATPPLPGGDQPDALIACLEAVLGSSGDRQVVVAADLAGVPDDGPAQLEHLGTMVHETADAGADGWWQTSPIDGWHWQRGFTAAPGVVDRGRTVRAAASAFNQP